MLRTKLFQGIAVLVLVIGGLSALIGVKIIKTRTVEAAQSRVQLDLGSAWSVYNADLHEMESILKLAAGKQIFLEACLGDMKNAAATRSRLEVIRRTFGMDFLTIVSRDGQVIMRAAPPYNSGDYQAARPHVARALKGDPTTGTTLMTAGELEKEAEGLSDTAFIEFKETRRARATPKSAETRGMVMVSAIPITEGMQVVGVIYGGILLNKNDRIIDQISNAVYKDETYEGYPLGTATIFLMDSRITTTVREPNGQRAIGTRVSKEVANQVLDNGIPWVGSAFVVHEAYLSAYDPIHDLDGQIIGMLYVGILERPFTDLGRQIIARYAIVMAFGLAAALVFAFFMAGRLAQPIHELAQTAAQMEKGEPHSPVVCNAACAETASLVKSFNQMASALEEREARLKEANTSLTAMNKSYMDMLGFVSHELKSPVSAIMNYVYLLREHKVGDLNQKQDKAVINIDTNAKRIVEMVRHYLNLARIENGELDPVPTTVAVNNDVVQPLLDSLEGEISGKKMQVENAIGDNVLLHADLNMTRETFENLVSNAIKYGRENGRIRLAAEAQNGIVEFRVGNEGDGIPPERLPELFGKFSRIESGAGPGRPKGTGLGLFITKHIVESHGGSIEVTSTPGEWTEFRFTLPREKKAEE